MPSGNSPADQPNLLAYTVDQLSTDERPAPRAHLAPFGRLYAGHTDDAEKVRAPFRAELLKHAKDLLATAQRALVEGATTADEIRDMQRLEIWLARLVVEEAESKLPPP